jgi:HAD superfamily hydrolase (TIGR01509 family)
MAILDGVKLRAIVLDAMGVIYSVGDDVIDLLCPFIAEKGGDKDISKIQSLYDSASLGNMCASEFWEAVGINPSLEDEYLIRYQLTNGLVEFLEEIKKGGYEVWCLSNDLSEWSKKLRIRFELDNYFHGFVISGDVGSRKPDRAIYSILLSRLSTDPGNAVFVDDRLKNLDSAAALGFKTVLFDPAGCGLADKRHRVASNFDDLLLLLP